MTSYLISSVAPIQQSMTIGESHLQSAPRTLLRRSCLRKESAFMYGGASRSSRLDELSATKMITVRYSLTPKKTISFADQRGQHLALKREFSPADAPVCYCDVPIEVTAGRLTRRCSSSLDKWIAEIVADQHLLYMCVVSLLGCALIGLRRTAKS
ncbi:unnamed protein product [Peronospora destructor]|uniref:Uncharacterized protein n=1 Tax=Peronospora destructor TaxID=86335 RepID=A0AAV0TXP7_9STRA|nr:unnamed protein product [Peronospora destructor]